MLAERPQINVAHACATFGHDQDELLHANAARPLRGYGRAVRAPPRSLRGTDALGPPRRPKLAGPGINPHSRWRRPRSSSMRFLRSRLSTAPLPKSVSPCDPEEPQIQDRDESRRKRSSLFAKERKELQARCPCCRAICSAPDRVSTGEAVARSRSPRRPLSSRGLSACGGTASPITFSGVDDKPSIRASEWAQGYIRLQNGRALTGHSHDYERHGTTTLPAALEGVHIHFTTTRVSWRQADAWFSVL